MIYIEKDTTNEFALELSAVIPSDQIYFLIGILWEGEIEKEWRAIQMIDSSVNPCRYNKFTIIESTMGSDDLWIDSTITNQEIRLELGQYKYNVWSSEIPFEEPLDWNGKVAPVNTKPISTGRMIVVGEIETPYDSIIPNVSLPSVYD